MLSSRIGFLQEWIDGATVETSVEEAHLESDVTIGFAWTLYNHVLELFAKLLPIAARSSSLSQKDIKSLRAALGSLYLWGDTFENGKLELVLEESEDLKESILCSLVDLGRILVERK